MNRARANNFSNRARLINHFLAMSSRAKSYNCEVFFFRQVNELVISAGNSFLIDFSVLVLQSNEQAYD